MSASFSEHFASRDNIVWVALMFGEALINHRAMRIAEWHTRWIRGKAFPDKLDEAQPFLDWELQNFCDVGITHGT